MKDTSLSMKYDHTLAEEYAQKLWEDIRYGIVSPDEVLKEKEYLLIEFPFPSGEGLHVGHVRSYTALDIVARMHRMQGKSVLYPIGWDAFGLPTENYALKTGKDPRVITKENTDTFRSQLKRLSISFDWSREINTSHPEYYRWTQWIFLKLLEKGLAYRASSTVNWCPKDKIVLANEEVIQGECERCGNIEKKKEKEQWMLAITKYAERLHQDLDEVNFLPKIVKQQRDWIGKSEGAEISFAIADSDMSVKVFTTRADTLYGVTHLTLAPEHPLLNQILDRVLNRQEVEKYREEASKKTDVERGAHTTKTGIVLEGVHTLHPLSGKALPLYVAEYVLGSYGTGAIMAVPAHDERDREFARDFNIRLSPVIIPSTLEEYRKGEILGATSAAVEHGQSIDDTEITQFEEAKKQIREGVVGWAGEGVLINSGECDGMRTEEARAVLSQKAGGIPTTKYKLRDWIFSRQRYWGEPIPVIHCAQCGTVPVPEKDLPVVLPEVTHYEPDENGESPLAKIEEWVRTECPQCHGEARRETDVMPNWAGSSWYYLRYIDPHNTKSLAEPTKLSQWLPVDWYNGGMEHTTLHLLYSRFWHKFLFDCGIVPTKEPYMKRTSHGLILAQGGEKMSKSKGNVVNPDKIVSLYGADTLRMYEMFMGPFDQSVEWSQDSLIGPRRYIERLWKLSSKVRECEQGTVKPLEVAREKITHDIDSMSFNTVVSTLMSTLRELEDLPELSQENHKRFLLLNAPIIPHAVEYMWLQCGYEGHACTCPWPEARVIEEDTHITLVVQGNGKTRGTLEVPRGKEEAEILDMVKVHPTLKKYCEGEIIKVVFVKDKLINIVTR